MQAIMQLHQRALLADSLASAITANGNVYQEADVSVYPQYTLRIIQFV